MRLLLQRLIATVLIALQMPTGLLAWRAPKRPIPPLVVRELKIGTTPLPKRTTWMPLAVYLGPLTGYELQSTSLAGRWTRPMRGLRARTAWKSRAAALTALEAITALDIDEAARELTLDWQVFRNPNDPSLQTAAPTVAFVVPTSSATYDAGTASTLNISGTATAPTGVTICSWSNSLGGNGIATTAANGSWSVTSVPLTVGSNVLTVTCQNSQNIPGNTTLTVTRSSTSITCDVTTANLTLATIQTAVNNAPNGTNICLPSGSGTWNGGLNFLGTKNVNVFGASIRNAGTTTITNGKVNWGQDGGTCPQSGSRVAGITFNGGYNGDSGYVWQFYCAQGFRADHNIITYSVASDAIIAWGYTGSSGGVEGLIDHNTITYGRFIYYGSVSNDAGSSRWFESLNMGTSHAVYIEDNVIQWTNGSSSGYLNSQDGNKGCRYVLRFNSLLNGRTEFHSLQGDNTRACRMGEIYNNTWINNGDPSFRQWLFRGGTGAIFHETSDGNALNREIVIDNDRSHECSISSGVSGCPVVSGGQQQVNIARMCGWDTGGDQPNGNSFYDGNVTAGHGYPCRDQIGRSTDASLWASNYPNPAPAQSFVPLYIWRNLDPSGEIPVTLNCENSGIPCSHQSVFHIVESRDYYTYRSSFTGAAGIGEGPIESRPATCTTGVAYWATNQGTWRAGFSGTSGKMYVCTSPNTWTAQYGDNASGEPYTYPHPRQSS